MLVKLAFLKSILMEELNPAALSSALMASSSDLLYLPTTSSVSCSECAVEFLRPKLELNIREGT